MTDSDGQGVQGGSVTAGARRKSILLLKPFVPYPLDCGSNILTYNLLRALDVEFDVTLVTKRPEREAEAREALEAVCERVVFCDPPNLKNRAMRLRYGVTTRLKACFGNRPVAALYAELAFSDALQALFGENSYDLVQVDYWNLAELGSLCPNGTRRCILLHDVQPHVFEQEARIAEGRLRRWQLRRAAKATAAFERRVLRKFPYVLTVSQNDAESYRRMLPADSKVECVPTLFDVSGVEVAPDPGGSKLLFVGALIHRPNRDAVVYFVKEVLPLIRAEAPDVEFVVVGRNVPASIWKLQSACVRVTGAVPEVAPYLREAAVYVAPLRFGSGIKLKILEALAHGKAVVTTPAGAEGIEVTDGVNCLIAKGAEDFAASVVRLLRDRELRRMLGAAGRKMIEERHSPEAMGPRVRKIYRDMMKGQE